MTVHDLPVVNATLNGLSAVLLVAAFVCIRFRKVKAHATLMISALITSAAFLACYLIYHVSTPPRSIGLPHGALRTGYLAMLASHVVLAIVVLPLIYVTLARAMRKQFKRHIRISPITLAVWFYVSVTGVLVYLFLYQWAPHWYPAGVMR